MTFLEPLVQPAYPAGAGRCHVTVPACTRAVIPLSQFIIASSMSEILATHAGVVSSSDGVAASRKETNGSPVGPSSETRQPGRRAGSAADPCRHWYAECGSWPATFRPTDHSGGFLPAYAHWWRHRLFQADGHRSLSSARQHAMLPRNLSQPLVRLGEP
jgi:hypothetical protein